VGGRSFVGQGLLPRKSDLEATESRIMLPRRSPALPALFLALTIVAGCASTTGTFETTTTPSSSTATIETTESSATAGATTTSNAGTHATSSDYEWDAATETAVLLADGASTGGSGVAIDGDVVTINAAGTYRISGSLSDGQLAVETDSDEVVRLVLDGVDITNTTGASISVVDAEKVVIILATGSLNTLIDATTYAYPSADVDEPNAALFSTANLSFAGDGALSVTGNTNDGIASKDGLVIADGTITVTAVDDGIRSKDYLVVEGGAVAVTAGGDALKSDNEEDASLGYVAILDGTLELTADTDAIDATTDVSVTGGELTVSAGDDGIHSDARVEIEGGTIDIERSYEGIEGTQIVISGGDISVISEDDGLNVAGGDTTAQMGGGPRGGGGGGGEAAIAGYFVEMGGGTLVIDSDGDGFDSNGSATVTGGTIVVNGPTENMNAALDVNGEFLVSNATLVAAGSIGMAETPNAGSDQATLHLQFNASQPAGTIIRIQAADGTVIATFQAAKAFQSLVVSTPAIEPGVTYEVLTGGTITGESIGGLYSDGGYSGGTSIGNVTASAS
jgi:hypothetical protein